MAQLLTVQQAADRLALAPATVRKMLWAGELTRVYPTAKRGAVRIREEEVQRVIANGQDRKAAVPENGKESLVP